MCKYILQFVYQLYHMKKKKFNEFLEPSTYTHVSILLAYTLYSCQYTSCIYFILMSVYFLHILYTHVSILLAYTLYSCQFLHILYTHVSILLAYTLYSCQYTSCIYFILMSVYIYFILKMF